MTTNELVAVWKYHQPHSSERREARRESELADGGKERNQRQVLLILGPNETDVHVLIKRQLAGPCDQAIAELYPSQLRGQNAVF